MPTQKQVSKESGMLLRFNLDPESAHSMRNAQKYHEDSNNPISHSVIVRRALRLYFKMLQSLTSPDAIREEVIETKRAAKGVL